MENRRTITVCDNPFMSNLVQKTLEENGIICMAIDQTIMGASGGYGPMPGYAIQVNAKDEERAQALVDEIMAKRQSDNDFSAE